MPGTADYIQLIHQVFQENCQRPEYERATVERVLVDQSAFDQRCREAKNVVPGYSTSIGNRIH